MSRPDQSITFLRGFGFSLFRFPRASAQPLELMHRDGKDLTRLGMGIGPFRLTLRPALSAAPPAAFSPRRR